MRKFLINIHEEDLDEEFKDDLEGHVREALGSKFDFDADVSFSVNEII